MVYNCFGCDDVSKWQRPFSVLDPDLPINLLALKREVMSGNPIDGFAANVLTARDLLGKHFIWFAKKEVSTGSINIMLGPYFVDGFIKRWSRKCC